MPSIPRTSPNLIERQIRSGAAASGIWNVGGGRPNAMSLAQLSAWCAARFGARPVAADLTPRRWDVPWVVMDSSPPAVNSDGAVPTRSRRCSPTSPIIINGIPTGCRSLRRYERAGHDRGAPGPLQRLSVVMPARDQQASVGSTVEQLHHELCHRGVPHEIVVVDDGSTDATWVVLQRLTPTIRSCGRSATSGRMDSAAPSSAASMLPRATPS